MFKFQTRPRRWVAAATALVCAVTAAVFAWPTSPASAADTLREAVHATVAAGSASVSFDAAVNGPSGSTGSSGSGTVSFLTNEAVFSLGDSQAFPGGADLRITNDGVYLRAPALLGNLLGEGMEWLKFPAPPQGTPTSTTTSTTTTTTSSAPPTTAASIIHMIEVMEAQGMVVDEAGEFLVNGVQTDAYAFTDPDAPDQLSGTAYVNQETGELTRLEMNTVDATDATGQLKIDMVKSADPVDVPTPPADTTVDIATVRAEAVRAARALVCAAAVVVVALGACGGPEGRLDAAPDTTSNDEVRIGADSPLQVSTTAPPQVVNVPDKPGAAHCKLVVRPVGCFDTYQQLIQLVGGGIDMTKKLGG